jgi:polysaccharide biosynthesis/export protein
VRVILALILLCATGVVAAAQETTYRLQVGDRIAITVWQDERLNREITIGPDRNVSMPLVGHIQAVGLTLPALEQVIRQRLQPNYEVELDVNVAMLGTQPTVVTEPQLTAGTIFVTGEIASPGQHVIPPHTNVMQAIALAGGLGPFAAKRRIQIRRIVHGEQLLYTFNYSAVEAGYAMEHNIILQTGDVIIVPERWLLEFLQ